MLGRGWPCRGRGGQPGWKPTGNRASDQAGVWTEIQVDMFGELAQGRARPGLGVRTSGSLGATPTRCLDKCNARRGYLERPTCND